MEQVALVVGEALVDVVHGLDGTVREHPGGSAANAAVALARLGRPVRFVTAYGDDDRGRLLADHLGDNGVRLGNDPVVLDRTATAIATLGESGAATYDFDLEWRFAPPRIPDDVVPVVMLFGSIGAVLEPGASDVHRLVSSLRGSVLTCFDVNARPAVTGAGPRVADRAEAFVAVSDLVKASDEDLAALWPDLGEAAVVERFLALGAGGVVVTRGSAGAAWYGERVAVDVPMPAVTVADTIGAGDTLGAAVVDALWERGIVGMAAGAGLADLTEDDCREVLAHGIAAAAVAVSRPGADPPWRTELKMGDTLLPPPDM